MQQLIVTLDESAIVPSLSKAIAMLRGVDHVEMRIVQDTNEKNSKDHSSENGELPMRIQKLRGIFSDVNNIDTSGDPRLEYILNK